MDEYGKHYFNRIDLHVTEKEKKQVMKKFNTKITSIAGQKVLRVQHTDGYKYFVDGGWLLVRPSGTEPLIRFYAEADSPRKVNRLLHDATHL